MMKSEFLGKYLVKRRKQRKLISFISDKINLITSRTANISEDKKPSVLYLGLGDVAREEGGAGNTVSTQSF